MPNMNQIEEYCCGFCFGDTPFRVVLILKTHPEPQRGLLNGIGGRIDEDEPPALAMAHKFQEETGVETDAYAWSHFVTLSLPLVRVWFFRYFNKATLWNVRTTKGELVCTKGVWADANLGKYNLVPDLRWLIPLALDRGIAPGGVIFNDSPPILPPQEEEHHP